MKRLISVLLYSKSTLSISNAVRFCLFVSDFGGGGGGKALTMTMTPWNYPMVNGQKN